MSEPTPTPDGVRKDAPADKERAYHAFITTVKNKFDSHPQDVYSRPYSTIQSLYLRPEDPSIQRATVSRPKPNMERRGIFKGTTFTLYTEDKTTIVYEYTKNREVIKWVIPKEGYEGFKILSTDTIEDLDQVVADGRNLDENLRLEQQMGHIGQPASLDDVEDAISKLNWNVLPKHT